MTPEAYCQDKAAKSGSSFYYAFLFLSPPRRAAITALYAFCREVDDVVDETSDTALAATTLGWWRAEIDRLFAGQPTHPVTRALEPHLAAYDITRAHLLEIIAGMELDLHQSRYLDFAGLAHYCHHVAGVVGMMLGIGYCIGALAPLALGALRDVTGSFAVGLWVIAGAAVLSLITGALCSPGRLHHGVRQL